MPSERDGIKFLTQEELERLNPQIDWENPPPHILGTVNFSLWLDKYKLSQGSTAVVVQETEIRY